MKQHELREIERIVEERKEQFINDWRKHFLLETSRITNIERDGFWLLTRAGEYFISFADYPDFVGATLEKIFNFQENNGDFYWPDLDIDIELEALQHPERFPLKFKR